MRIILFLLAVALASCKTSKDQAKSDPVQTNTTSAPSQQPQAEQPPIEQAQQNPETVKPGAPLETLILGEWEWQQTICCGRTPHTETSESLKAPKILKFQNDGTLQYFSGTELSSNQTYKISYGLTDDKRPVITIGATRPGLLFIDGSSLIIDYGYVDLQKEFYVRRK